MEKDNELDGESGNTDQEITDDRFKKFSMNIESDNDNDEKDDGDDKIDLRTEKPKSNKGGVIYMGFIPEGMTIRNIRMLLGKYGEIGRVYLEREGGALGNSDRKLNRKSNKFVEGWIEFKKKSVAKMVASHLNGQTIGGKRRTKFYGSLWNLKYLKRFKWSHLAEQMAYEKAMIDQRLRLEINQAKKEADFYSNMIDRSRNKREIFSDPNRTYKQRMTDEQIRSSKATENAGNPDGSVDDLLESIFK